MDHRILLLFSFFLDALIIYQYASRLFIPSRSVRFQLLSVNILYIILFILSLLKRTELHIVGFFTANALFLFTQYKLSLPLSLFHSAMLSAIMGASRLSLMGIMSKFPLLYLPDSNSRFIFSTILGKLFFFAAVYLLTHLYKKKNISQEYVHSQFFLMLIPLASVFIMYTFLFISRTSVFIYPTNFLVIICSILMLLMNFLVFGINKYHQKMRNDFTDMQLLFQKESDSARFYDFLLSQNENQKILIHDIKKHLQSIQLLNDNKSFEEIGLYIHNLMESFNLKATSQFCDNEMLNAILCRYQQQCKTRNISFYVDVRKGSVQHIYHHDLTALFCNLLDNAQDSAEKIQNSFIELTVRKQENSPLILIIMINSCDSAPLFDHEMLPLSRRAETGLHGYGLKSIRKIVTKYHGNLQMYYDKTFHTFHTIITLKSGTKL